MFLGKLLLNVRCGLSSVLQVFFKEASVKQVDVPTLTGAFGILPAHVPTLQVLRPGVVTVFSDDGSSTKYFGKKSLGLNQIPPGFGCKRKAKRSGFYSHQLQVFETFHLWTEELRVRLTVLIKHPFAFRLTLCVCVFAVSSGSVTVNVDSSVQLLAEEAVPLDQLDVAVSIRPGDVSSWRYQPV